MEQTPILLVLDGHSSRLSTSFISTCRKNNIIVLVLPAHTSSVMQALDCSPNGVLKATFAKESALRVNMPTLPERTDNESIVEGGINKDAEEEWPDLPEEINIFAEKNQFTNSAAAHRRLLAEVLPIAVEAATSYTAMNAGWSKCGLVPFNPAKVLGMVQAGDKPVEHRGFMPNISGKEITSVDICCDIWMFEMRKYQKKLSAKKLPLIERERNLRRESRGCKMILKI